MPLCYSDMTSNFKSKSHAHFSGQDQREGGSVFKGREFGVAGKPCWARGRGRAARSFRERPGASHLGKQHRAGVSPFSLRRSPHWGDAGGEQTGPCTHEGPAGATSTHTHTHTHAACAANTGRRREAQGDLGSLASAWAESPSGFLPHL